MKKKIIIISCILFICTGLIVLRTQNQKIVKNKNSTTQKLKEGKNNNDSPKSKEVQEESTKITKNAEKEQNNQQETIKSKENQNVTNENQENKTSSNTSKIIDESNNSSVSTQLQKTNQQETPKEVPQEIPKEPYPDLYAYTMEECLSLGEKKIIEIMTNNGSNLTMSYSCVQKNINNETIFYVELH